MRMLQAAFFSLLIAHIAACNREDKLDMLDEPPDTGANIMLDELQMPLPRNNDPEGEPNKAINRARDAEWE
jgi:hypothetical protein